MHQVVIDKPYRFVPPYKGRFWPWLFQRMAAGRLASEFGVESVKCEGLPLLGESVDAGHGIVLAPNHCRPCDPLVVAELCRQAGVRPHTMASWHVFMESRLKAFVLRRVGGFSVYREGTDRQALQAAINILTEAKRPLVLFPEGVVTRTNDRLLAMMEGVSLIARSAAKQRSAAKKRSASKRPVAAKHSESEQDHDRTDGSVVVHPVAIRYHFHGDLEKTLHETLDDIEARLSWRPKRDADLVARVLRVGGALLWLKEIEYFGAPRSGPLSERVNGLIDGILDPIEQEWIAESLRGRSESGSSGGRAAERSVVARVKQLRTAILPEMIDGDLSEQERARRWDQLADLYLAQQIGHYPPEYVRSNPTRERLLETVEKFEEDLTDHSRVHRPMSVTVRVGEAIGVSPKRERGVREDPVTTELETRLRALLGIEPAVRSGSEEENSKPVATPEY